MIFPNIFNESVENIPSWIVFLNKNLSRIFLWILRIFLGLSVSWSKNYIQKQIRFQLKLSKAIFMINFSQIQEWLKPFFNNFGDFLRIF